MASTHHEYLLPDNAYPDLSKPVHYGKSDLWVRWPAGYPDSCSALVMQVSKGLQGNNPLIVEFVVNLVITALLVLPYIMSRLTMVYSQYIYMLLYNSVHGRTDSTGQTSHCWQPSQCSHLTATCCQISPGLICQHWGCWLDLSDKQIQPKKEKPTPQSKIPIIPWDTSTHIASQPLINYWLLKQPRITQTDWMVSSCTCCWGECKPIHRLYLQWGYTHGGTTDTHRGPEKEWLAWLETGYGCRNWPIGTTWDLGEGEVTPRQKGNQCKWVYWLKWDCFREIEQYKAHFLVMGHA